MLNYINFGIYSFWITFLKNKKLIDFQNIIIEKEKKKRKEKTGRCLAGAWFLVGNHLESY